MKRLEDNAATVFLRGQNSIELPVKAGINKINITVKSGKIQLNHGSYTPDGGTWLSSPSDGRKSHYPMTEGNTYEIVVDIRESFGRLDRISIVNVRLFCLAEFEYIIE